MPSRSTHKRLISRAAFALLGLFSLFLSAVPQQAVAASYDLGHFPSRDQAATAIDQAAGLTNQYCLNNCRVQNTSEYEFPFVFMATGGNTYIAFINEESQQCDPSTLAKGSRFKMTNRSEWDRAIDLGKFQSGGKVYTIDSDIPGMWQGNSGTLWGDETCDDAASQPDDQPQTPEQSDLDDSDFCATTSSGDEICAIPNPDSCDGFYGSVNGSNTCVSMSDRFDNATNCAESASGTMACFDSKQWTDDNDNPVQPDAEIRDENNNEGHLYGPSNPATKTSDNGSRRPSAGAGPGDGTGQGDGGSDGGGTGEEGEGEEPCTGEDCNVVQIDEDGTPDADDYTGQMDGAWDDAFTEQQDEIEDWSLPEAFPDPEFDISLPSGEGCQQVNLTYASWSVPFPNARGCQMLTDAKNMLAWLLGIITVLYLIKLFLNAKASGE